MDNKKYKIIIDTDPGVDDSVCLIYAFFDKHIDLKLITTVVGNVEVETGTRNTLHLLDILGVDFPVAQGAKRATCRESIDAKFIHQEHGLGGYIPPKTTARKIIADHAVDAMHKTIMEGDGDIVIVALGPHTNIAHLIKKYPDVVSRIPKIVFMGGSPFGHPDYPDHISFNISSDPEAFKVVLDSKIPLVMAPSDLGRRKAHLTEEYVNGLKNFGDVGKLMYLMYSKYWEPNYPDKRVATNDICALLALIYPEMFTFEKCFVTVNTTDAPGKTVCEFSSDGNVELVTGVDREEFIKYLNADLSEMKHIKIDFANCEI
ncbi:MAG: nucleoside hydrolase [Clostridia bacterium]|nr:nucleoside hydrolase [Clostridia bacterium]